MKNPQSKHMKRLFSSIHKHLPLAGLAATAMLCGYAGTLHGGEPANAKTQVNEVPSSKQTKQVQTQSKTDSKDNKKNEVKPVCTPGKQPPADIKDNKENEVKPVCTPGKQPPADIKDNKKNEVKDLIDLPPLSGIIYLPFVK